MRPSRMLFTLALSLFLIGSGAALPAGEEGPPKPREGGEPPPDAKRMKELMAKRREEGPPDEFVKKPMRPPDPGTMELAALQADLNVVDRAALASAQALMQAGKRDEALAVAEKIATKSPDAEAAGVARLLAGRWYIEKGEADAGHKNLRAVTGRAAPLALVPLVEPLLKKQDALGLVAACKDLTAAQPTGLDRCRVLKAMLDLLERPGPELNAELRAEVAGALSALVPYEEALAAKDALAKERSAAPRPPGPPPGFGPGMFGPGMGGPGMGGGPFNEADLPEGLRGKAKALRDMPPEQRREAMQDFRVELQKKIDALTKEGRAGEAEKLKQNLDRLQHMEERMKDGRKGKFGAKDPDQMKAEIKKLEDQGFKEEAEKLRKELEGIQPKATENF